MDEEKTYKFKNGITAVQEEIDTEQFHSIIVLLADVDVQNLDEIKSFKFLKILKKKNIIAKFLSVILKDTNGNPIPDSKLILKFSDFKKVYDDFFSFNPELISELKNFGSKLASGLTSVLSSSAPK